MERSIIVKMKFGSHLYGTNTPQSDTDFKSVAMPSSRDMYLGRVFRSLNPGRKNKAEGLKNTSTDIDHEIFSLQYFVKLACQGQTVAIDMLHAPVEFLEYSTYVWQELREHRKKFYSKNLQAFVGYARSQAAKYGVKGSRLNTIRQVHEFMTGCDPERKIGDYWEKLPKLEHTQYEMSDKNAIWQYVVCGKRLLSTEKIKYAIIPIKKFLENYGKRAEQAAKNEGIDWKAVSHALRAAFQLKEIYLDGDIKFPLKEAEYLKSVKLGKLDYTTEVAPTLESTMNLVENLAAASDYPEKVDTEFWDDWIVETVARYLR